MINRRGLLAGLAIADLSSAQAQPVWQPTRPVQLVVGFAPGGGGDLIARAIAQAVTPLYPQPLLVLNRAGASGAIAAQYVAAQPPDGHSMMLGGGSELTSLPAFQQVPYDPKRSFRSVIRLTRQSHFILTRAGSDFRTFSDVMSAARARPGFLSYGTTGLGGLYHAVFLLLERQSGTEFLHVPYTGGGPALLAATKGEVDLSIWISNEMRGLVESGDLRVLAVASRERDAGYPDVPTLVEMGFNVDIENMKGWVAPAGTSDSIVAYHHDRFREALSSQIWRDFLDRTRSSDGYADGRAFQAAMDGLLDRITAAVRPG